MGDLLPDLIALSPADFHIEVATNGHHFLRFSQAVANIGEEKLQVFRGSTSDPLSNCDPNSNPPRYPAYQDIFQTDGSYIRKLLTTCIEYHELHGHYHIIDFAKYELWNETLSSRLRANDKVSFCLRDGERLKKSIYNGPIFPRNYITCNTNRYGISPGWLDRYSYQLEGQWIDLTIETNGQQETVSDGVYYVVVTVNPNLVLSELRTDNNQAKVKVQIYDNGTKVKVV